MRLTDLWQSSDRPTLSFELFPARSEEAAVRLDKAIAELTALKPDFCSVTFGAGGSTREGSRQLLDRLQSEFGQQMIAYFACYGLSPDDITAVLDDYKALGIETVLLVRGDPPHDESFKPHPDSFTYASELVAFVRPKYDLCLGVAAYPEGHIDAPSREKDIEFLKLKIDNGAEYIICNYFYDNAFFYDFVERVRAAGIDVPILPGVMPIYSVKMMERLAAICGATITDAIQARIAALPEGDKAALVEWGIEFATAQCRDLLANGVPGLHVYTMDRSKSAVGIVNKLREANLL